MYRLDAAQTAVVERAREIAERAIGPQAARVDADGTFPREGIAALGEAGFLGQSPSLPHGAAGHRTVRRREDRFGVRLFMVRPWLSNSARALMRRGQVPGDGIRQAAEGRT